MTELPMLAANKSAGLPFDSLEVFLADVKKLRLFLHANSIEEVERGLQHASALARKIEAAKRPINPSELASELAMMVAAFPHGKAAEDFAAVLLASVGVMRPSVGAVKLATRHLIFTAKFLPAVSRSILRLMRTARRRARGGQTQGLGACHLRGERPAT